jgi:hypothetical protein
LLLPVMVGFMYLGITTILTKLVSLFSVRASRLRLPGLQCSRSQATGESFGRVSQHDTRIIAANGSLHIAYEAAQKNAQKTPTFLSR